MRRSAGVLKMSSPKGSGTGSDRDLLVSDNAGVSENLGPAKLLKGEETILLVDDEDVNIEVMSEILEMLGYRVFSAENGQEALRIYREKWREIDLVILDMIMPDLKGGDVFDLMREMNPRARVILSTGYGWKGQAADIMSRGCRAFIKKPFHIEELSRKVRQVLDETE
ncbi:MAG: Chemotaxis protein CheY [Syntrophus sp. PtaB.Bin075]|nr:MAG: Chemotaxis protein CheY [Syntrophus sp. PtaB.Bin075]